MRLAVLLIVVAVSVTAQEPMTVTRSVWDGVFTTQQAKRGESLYTRYCAECHAADLLGRTDYPSPPQLPGVFIRSGSPPLRGAMFISNWAGLSLGSLYERNRISMPQFAPGSLTRQQNADILAYMLQENGYPAGSQDLATTKEAPEAILIGQRRCT
jgi:mono/diheme cytochrome c family protein